MMFTSLTSYYNCIISFSSSTYPQNVGHLPPGLRIPSFVLCVWVFLLPTPTFIYSNFVQALGSNNKPSAENIQVYNNFLKFCTLAYVPAQNHLTLILYDCHKGKYRPVLLPITSIMIRDNTSHTT